MKITIEVTLERGYYPTDDKTVYRGWETMPVTIDFFLQWLTKIAKTIYSVEQTGETEKQGYSDKGKIYQVVFEPKEFPTEPIFDFIRDLEDSLGNEEKVSRAWVKEKKLEFNKREWKMYLTKVMMQKVTK